MKTKQKSQPVNIGRGNLMSNAGSRTGAGADGGHLAATLPPGRWDSLVRESLERSVALASRPDPWTVFGFRPKLWQLIESVLGPVPDPWRVVFSAIVAKHPEIWDIFGGGPGAGFGSEVSLNPQPLPPRFTFLLSLGRTVARRAELLQELGAQQGIIIVGGYISRFVDDFCGNDLRLRWPFPIPRPNWLGEKIDGLDLLVIATQFDQAASEAFNRDLAKILTEARTKLVRTGLEKMR